MNGQNKIIANNSSNFLSSNISDNNITDGIPDPKLVLYSRERIQLEWKEPHKIGAGLANLGNTCFINSVLQCLTYCPPLVNYLLFNDDEHSIKCNIAFCMTCEMTKHIRLAHSHSGDTIKPIYICQLLKPIAKHFTFGRQEDAHEFLRYVIDNMWRSCLSIYELNNNQKLDPLSKETTAINRIFGGYHRSQVICFQCKEKSNTYDYFMNFILDIKNFMSLEEALDKFVAAEILQHDNAYKCPRCKRKVLAKKQFTVHSEPNVATFQLKRFDYNEVFGGKITKSITYPEILNLRPYMSETKGPPILYKLNSVLVHLGPTCNSGHYFCYVRNSNNCWYLMDDSRIVQVNLNQVLNQQAYVLFYVRIDTDFNKPNPVPNPVKNFVSHTAPHGIQLSSVSSPEMTFRNHKYNYNVCHNGNYVSAHNSTKLNTTANPLKTIAFNGMQSMNKQNLNNYESNTSNIASDSSEEELSKQSSNINSDFGFDSDPNRRLSVINHKLDINDEHKSSKLDKMENNVNKSNSSKQNRCTSIANGNGPQVLDNSDNKMSHNSQYFEQTINEFKPKSEYSNDVFETRSLSNGTNIETNQSKSRDNHILDFMNHSSDVPDSPSARSTISYFSDIGDNGYISRKAVESILNLQRNSLKKKSGNRNSSSSLESFDIMNGGLVSNKNQLTNERSLICSLQRHDSGNSSGDRHSASSASVSSIETPYYSYTIANRRPFANLSTQKYPPSPKLSSDQGYDSFSLSSTDSYPSVGGSSSPGKLNPRLKQIPEDVQLMELMNTSAMLDCDKLCNEADILLLKSHEKEREGDLKAAAVLSDSAASKARSAMDAPYSNHQTLITAKMKHSMCVMRSASLHKRVKELEAEDKRRMKAEQLIASTTSTIEYHHSRQSSRDSTHSKHSRQGSKDSKDGKTKEFNTKHASLELNKNRINEGLITAGKTLEIYATLPKKGSKKRILQQSLSSLTSLRIKSSDESNVYKDLICRRDSVPNFVNDSSLALSKKKVENNRKSLDINKSVLNNITKGNSNNGKQVKNDHSLRHSSRESDFSDYYSEWEATRTTQQPLERPLSGSVSCKENDSEFYGEVGTFATQSTGKKQHKVRRKLLMGGFMKRKNRSLPDLREGVKDAQNDCLLHIQSELSHEESINGKTVAQISSKGFHQPHRAFISERGLYQRPSLLKVSPPLIESPHKQSTNLSTQSPSHSSTATFSQNELLPRPPTPPKPKTTASVVPNIEENSIKKDNKLNGINFLEELALKRAEIMKSSNREKLTESANNQTSKEQINNGISINSNIIVKPGLKFSLPKPNQNLENDIYERMDYNPNSSNSIISQIVNSIPKSLSSQTLPNNSSCEQSNDSSAGMSSVKDLASKFEKIMNKQEEQLPNDKLNETLENNEQKKHNSHLNSSYTSVGLLPTNKSDDSNISKQVVTTSEANKCDDYSVHINIPTINSLIPMKNCLSPSIRPNRPPDYQTAMKRIGMLRNDKSVLNIQQTRQYYMNVSGNIVQPNSPRSPNPQTFQIPSQINESQKCVALKGSCEQSKQQLVQTNQPNFDEKSSSVRKKNGFKKSVSFSDQVVLVASQEEQEEYLPNPILERILGKNSNNSVQQSI